MIAVMLAHHDRLGYFSQMLDGIYMLGPTWRKWILRFVLLSFVGLYSVGLLPHEHANLQSDQDCPICHVVSTLSNLAAHSSPPGLQLTAHFLLLLLVLSWVPAVVARTDKHLFFKRSRAPPVLS
jgi:hypothetical protein